MAAFDASHLSIHSSSQSRFQQQEQQQQTAPDHKRPCNNSVSAQQPAGSPNTLKLIFQDMNGGEVHMKVRDTMPLERAMAAYAQHKHAELEGYRFLFDCRRIMPYWTARDLGLEDGDTVDVMFEQLGD
jgi:small ubiquitin-related modifier